MKQPKIAVVGGSLVGPATEILLRHAGYADITTYEAARKAHPQSGGVLGIRDSAADALAQAGVPMDRCIALSSPDVESFDMIGDAYHKRGVSTYPGTVTSWDLLHNALVERVDVQLGSRVVGIGDDGKRAQLTFANGRTDDADLVIFADGRKSTGRTLLDPERKLVYAGYVTWRGLIKTSLGEGVDGFRRHYDFPHGTLFSLTSPVSGDGRNYWEFSHNLSAEAFTKLAGRAPTDLAFLLPNRVTPFARAVLDSAAKAYLPPEFRDLVAATDEIMAIPTLDVPAPDRAAFKLGESYAVLAGDALSPVRLQVGAGLHMGIGEILSLADHVQADDPDRAMREWSDQSVNALAPWLELGRSRAHRNNLGTYMPVRPGWTTAPLTNVWGEPEWVPA